MSPFSMIFILLAKNLTAENQNHKNKKVPFPNAQRRAVERPARLARLLERKACQTVMVSSKR